MATKREVIEAIDRLYTDDEDIVWQTVSLRDVDSNIERWTAFVEEYDNSSVVADAISALVQEYLDEFDENE